MGLETLNDIYNCFTQTPARAILDLSNHLLTGIALADIIYPDESYKRKITKGAVGGVSPDIDFATDLCDIAKHRGITHSIEALIAGAAFPLIQNATFVYGCILGHQINDSLSSEVGMTSYLFTSIMMYSLHKVAKNKIYIRKEKEPLYQPI